MPQMANAALSENWLFKELGDIHWELLSKGLNTPWAEATPIVAPVNTVFKFYPNPAVNEMVLNFEYDENWIGNTISVSAG